MTALYSHPLFGAFYRLEGDEGAYDLVSASGADGGLEVLAP